ncbi:MAG: hypothetical protein ACREGH_02540 [Minisyncoccia bacterium]
MDNGGSAEGGFYWVAPSHTHTERRVDWYWAVGIVAVVGIGASIWFGDYIFALIIAAAAACLMLIASRYPREFDVLVTPRGITVDNETYAFGDLHSFWVHEAHPVHPKLYLATRGILHPHLAIIIDESINPGDVRDYLGQYVPEEPGHSLATFFTERLGL